MKMMMMAMTFLMTTHTRALQEKRVLHERSERGVSGDGGGLSPSLLCGVGGRMIMMMIITIMIMMMIIAIMMMIIMIMIQVGRRMIEEEEEVGSPTTPAGCLAGKTKTKKIM